MSNHSTSRCWRKKRCNKCKKIGHIARRCRSKDTDQANFIEEDEYEESILYACHSAIEQKDNMWYLDSGCTNHMTGNGDIFSDIDTSYMPEVRLGNGAIVKAKGKGSIAIQTKLGVKFIRDVLYVPALKQNLLSVGQLIQNGYAVHFENRGCKIIDKKNKNLVIARVSMEKSRNFQLQLRYAPQLPVQEEVEFALRAQVINESDNIGKIANNQEESTHKGGARKEPKHKKGTHKASHYKSIVCYNCGRRGHYARVCWHKKAVKEKISSIVSIVKQQEVQPKISRKDKLLTDKVLFKKCPTNVKKAEPVLRGSVENHHCLGPKYAPSRLVLKLVPTIEDRRIF